MPCDYSKYPTDWKEIRARILERAGNCCEVCKVPNREWVVRGMFRGVEAYQGLDQLIFRASDGYLFHGTDNMDSVECHIDTKTIKIVLTIAHLDHDADNQNVTDDRLKAMCQKCHNNYDKDYRSKNRKHTIKAKKKQFEMFAE
jgi:hypothetical protein